MPLRTDLNIFLLYFSCQDRVFFNLFFFYAEYMVYVCVSVRALKCRTAGCSISVSFAIMRFLQRQPTLQHTGITYFSRAFVFDGELALLFAVIDVAQLVVKQIRRRRSEPGKKHRE